MKSASERTTDQYPAMSTEQARSIKDLLYDQKRTFFAGPTREIPNGRDSIGPSCLRDSQSEHRIRFAIFLSDAGFSNIIKYELCYNSIMGQQSNHVTNIVSYYLDVGFGP